MTDSRIYIDTAPFIYYLEQNTLYFDVIRKFFKHSYENHIALFTSAATVEEYCVYPLMHNDNESVDAFNAFIDGMKIDVVSVDKDIAFEASLIRAKYKGFKALDSIHLATAKLAGCSTFLTNDKQLRQMEDLKVVTMDDLIKQ